MWASRDCQPKVTPVKRLTSTVSVSASVSASVSVPLPLQASDKAELLQDLPNGSFARHLVNTINDALTTAANAGVIYHGQAIFSVHSASKHDIFSLIREMETHGGLLQLPAVTRLRGARLLLTEQVRHHNCFWISCCRVHVLYYFNLAEDTWYLRQIASKAWISA